tara:strand:- start:295 stop:594 length:300 start_codon:yes stop_codon:yes gene_type:complete
MSAAMLSALSSAFSSTFSADLRNQVGVAVARKTLDAAEAEGQAAVQMIEDSAAVGAQARASGRSSGLQITPSSDLSAGRGRISAQPVPSETGRQLDVTA